jgi:hypothetical protein
MKNWKRLAMVVLALPTMASEPKNFLEAQASMMSVAPETRRLVEGSSLAGISFGVGYRGWLPSTGLQHRVHVDLFGLKAKPETGMDGAAPKHLEFGWDLIFNKRGWSFYSGFLGVKWKQAIDAQTSNEFRDLNEAGTANARNSAKGTKIGGRVGVEYAFRRDFSVFAGYTQTEFNKKHNPGWWNVGVLYRGVAF